MLRALRQATPWLRRERWRDGGRSGRGARGDGRLFERELHLPRPLLPAPRPVLVPPDPPSFLRLRAVLSFWPSFAGRGRRPTSAPCPAPPHSGRLKGGSAERRRGAVRAALRGATLEPALKPQEPEIEGALATRSERSRGPQAPRVSRFLLNFFVQLDLGHNKSEIHAVDFKIVF